MTRIRTNLIVVSLLIIVLAIFPILAEEAIIESEGQNPKACIGEGEIGNIFNEDVCCENLVKISNSGGENCLAPSDGSFVCAKCGNGICGNGENKCNCDEDCCEEGDTKKYTCPDGTQVEWCHCSNGAMICIGSPENACSKMTCIIPSCEGAYETGQYYDDGCPKYDCPDLECDAGDVKKYTCPDGTKVDWCSCSNNAWVCINSPENNCQHDSCKNNEDCKPDCVGKKRSPCGCSNGQYVCATTLECNKECGAECESNEDCDYGYKCDNDLITGTCRCEKVATECNVGDIIKYTCSDGIKVDWCSCPNGQLNCIGSPENACHDLHGKCIDSDGGLNYYKKGKTTGLSISGEYIEVEDFCTHGHTELTKDKMGVEEGICGNIAKIKCNEENYYCGEGGLCVECSPEGYESIVIEMNLGTGTNVIAGSNWFECIYGCKDGACLRSKEEINNLLCPIGCICEEDTIVCMASEDIDEMEVCPVGCVCNNNTIVCDVDGGKSKEDCSIGCKLNNTCVLPGTRLIINKTKQYCTINSQWKEQKQGESECINSFECKSNLCIDDKCVDSGLWKMFLNWLKKLF